MQIWITQTFVLVVHVPIIFMVKQQLQKGNLVVWLHFVITTTTVKLSLPVVVANG